MTSSNVSVVGAHRLWIAVYHYRFDADFPHRERRVNTAVVELDALAYAVGPAAEDHYLPSAGRISLALAFVGRVKVGSGRLEFRPAGVNRFVNRVYFQRLPVLAEVRLFYVEQRCHVLVAEAVLFRLSHQARRQHLDLLVTVFHGPLCGVLYLLF